MRRLRDAQAGSRAIHHQSPFQRRHDVASQIPGCDQHPQPHRHEPQRRANLAHGQKIKQKPEDENRPDDAEQDAREAALSQIVFVS
jgi:hypothetical protein